MEIAIRKSSYSSIYRAHKPAQLETTSRSETTRQKTVPKKCELHVGRCKNMYPMSSNGVRILRAGVTVVKLELKINNSSYTRIPRSGTLQKLSSVRSSEAESQLDASVVPRTWPYKLLRMQTVESCKNSVVPTVFSNT